MSTPEQITFRAMGSQFQAWVEAETSTEGAALLAEVPAWVEAYEARLSRFRPESELMQLNARAGDWITVSDDLLDVILAALDAARLTDGLYNPLVLPALLAAGYDRTFEDVADDAAADDLDAAPIPAWTEIDVDVTTSEVRLPAGTLIDLGGIAKGWTAERIADRLEAHGPCLVDAGGDLVARGTPTGVPTGAPSEQSGWPVGIAEPGPQAAADPTHSLLVVSLKDQAIATSGTDYHRWTRGGTLRHHIIDPRTARPAESDVLSATIIDVDAERAEAYAKLVILLGARAGLAWLAEHTQASGLVACADGAILASAAFQAAMSCQPSAKSQELKAKSPTCERGTNLRLKTSLEGNGLMKRMLIFAAVGGLLVGGGLLLLRPHSTTQAQSNSEVITLDDATPGIDVVVSAPPGTSGVIGLEIAQASVVVTDAAGATVFETADPRVSAVELRFLPDAGSHTLTIERLPGMANAYVRVVSQLDLTDLGPAQIVSTAGLGLQQEVDLPLMAVAPANRASVTIPPETRATLIASVPGGAVMAQVVDSSDVAVATLYNSLFDGLALTLDSGTYSVALRNNRAGADTIASVKLMPATQGLLSDLVLVSNDNTQAAAPDCTIAINASSINLRSGPGTGYTVLEYGFRGQELPVGGTDASGSWFVVGTNGGSAWMSGTLGILHGTCAALPVYDVPYREAQQAQIIVQQPSGGGSFAQPQTNPFPLAFAEHEEHEDEHEGDDD